MINKSNKEKFRKISPIFYSFLIDIRNFLLKFK